MDGNRPRN